MNYLQLVNKLKDAAGVAGNDITDVSIKEPHMHKLLCDWIRQAWIDIQTDPRLKGSFLYRINHSFLLPDNLLPREYSYQDFQLSDDITFDYDMFFVTESLTDLPAKKLRKADLDSANTLVPVAKEVNYVVPLGPNKFHLVPTNEEQLILICNYWDAPQSLTDNGDVPEGIQSQHHKAIVFKALISYAIYDAAEEILQFAVSEYQAAMRELYHHYGGSTLPNKVRFNCPRRAF